MNRKQLEADLEVQIGFSEDEVQHLIDGYGTTVVAES